MRKITLTGSACALGWLLMAGGCERDPVAHEMKDLRAAEKNSPEVVEELQKKLEEERADVAEVERKLELAKQGITDEVLEEREELQEAMEKQGEDVRQELRQHEEKVGEAHRALERTSPEGRATSAKKN